jgi:hypothetical protein
MKTSFSTTTKPNRINRAAAQCPAPTKTHLKLNKHATTTHLKPNKHKNPLPKTNATIAPAIMIPVIPINIDTTTTTAPPANTPTTTPTTAKRPKSKSRGRSHKYYAVAKGRVPGIYTSWPITQTQVCGFSGALFQGFHDYTEAQHFLYAYATNISINDRNYLGQTLGLSTTNVNVHINAPASANLTVPGPASVTSPAVSSPAFKDPPSTPSTQASDLSDEPSPDETPDPTPDDTNDEISGLNDDDEIHSYNSFDSDAHYSASCRFYVLLQVLHVDIPDSLDEQTIAETLTTTLAHHQLRLPDHLLLFQVGEISYRETKRVSRPSQAKRAHYFQLILVPTQTEDQFDPELFHDQCLTFALQKWHLYNNSQFDSDHALCSPVHPSPPSKNPWAPHMNLMLPACNSSSDPARGCLLGILPDFFGCSRRATIDLLRIVFDSLTPHLPTTAFGEEIGNWFSFQEYFGLRPTYLQHNTKKAKTFFICCFCDEAWSVLLSAAKNTGPINIHGCLAKISEFPPNNKKDDIINKTNQQLKDFRDLHAVHTDRLRLIEPEDERNLLFLTPNLMALSPKYVDHLPSPICYTLFFQPDMTTSNFTNQNLHKAHIPPNLLAPAPLAPYLRAAAVTTTQSPPRKPAPFDESGLNDIFSQWSSHQWTPVPTALASHKEGSASNPIDPDSPTWIAARSSNQTTNFQQLSSTQKRPRQSHPSRIHPFFNPRQIFKSEPADPSTATPDPPIPPEISQLASPLASQPNYYTVLDPDPADNDELSMENTDELAVEHTQPLLDAMLDTTQQLHSDAGSDTDLNIPTQDRMLTDSPSDDSSYSPSLTGPNPSDDDFSADASDNISAIYADQRYPPQKHHPDTFDLMDFEVALSQTAFLHYQQINEHVIETFPQHHDEFQELLSQAVRKNKDPTSLETTVKGWTARQP